ncbi:MAG: hypothetical protein U1D55_09025 [Phycisphaerae bacterium]
MKLAIRIRVIALGVVVLGVYLAHAGLFWSQINDDAFITWRFSKFLTLGRGPFFNVGEHVEGYTNFSLMLAMAGVIRLLGDDAVLIAGRVGGVASGVAALGFTWALAARWLRHESTLRAHAASLAWLAPALAAISPSLALNSTTGLETSLFAAAVLCGLWLLQWSDDRNHWRGTGIAYAAACLTRPEGAPVFAATFLGRLIRGDWRRTGPRRRLLLDAAIVAGTVAVHLLLRMWLYDGELVPNTYFAKRGGFQNVSPAAYVLSFVAVHLAFIGFVTPFGALLAPRLRRVTLPAMMLMPYSVWAIFAAGADWMPGARMFAPFVPIWGALTLASVAAVVRRQRRSAAGLAAITATVFVCVMGWWQLETLPTYLGHVWTRAIGYRDGHMRLADWLRERARPGDTIALMDIGIVGYLCIDQNVLDITGLTDRHIAKSPGCFLDKQFDVSYVFDRKPRFIVLAMAGPDARYWDGKVDKLDHYSGIESRIARHVEFAAHYRRVRNVAADATPLERLAAELGAQRVFRHEHPGQVYLLAAFERDSQ